RAKGSHRKLGDLGSGHRCRVGAEYDGPHREDEESKPMMHGHEKSDLAIVAGKSANNVAPRCGAIRGGVSRSGVDGAKGGDQGECEPAKHVPGAEPDKRVTGAGSHAATTCRLDPRWEKLWGGAAEVAGGPIRRIALAYEAGRDGFWLARWLIACGIEAHVIHSASVAVSRERKRAKTDRLDAAMLMRVFLGWLRGERGHCGMVAIPTMEEEDARRPSRERDSLVNERSRIVNRMKSALARLGIRGFKPHLRRAPERLACLRTAEGTGLPANII